MTDAKRIEILEQGVSSGLINASNASLGAIYTAMTLARAHLASLAAAKQQAADDARPIDGAWLVEQGAGTCGGGQYAFEDDDIHILVMIKTRGSFIAVGEMDEELNLPFTRGTIRRLREALCGTDNKKGG